MSNIQLPQEGNVAARYIINNENSTDKIVCYGKETMNLEQLENALKKHFKTVAESSADSVKNVLKNTSEEAKTKISNLQATSNSGKTPAQHLQAAANSVGDAAQALGKTIQNQANNLFEQATETAQKAVSKLNETANKAASSVANVADNLKTQAQTLESSVSKTGSKLQSKIPGIYDNVNPTIGLTKPKPIQTANVNSPEPLRNQVANSFTVAQPPINKPVSSKPVSIANTVNPQLGGKRKRKRKRTKKHRKRKMKKTHKRKKRKSRRKHKKKMRKTHKKK